MKSLLTIALFASLLLTACRSANPLFRGQTPHERYAQRLADAGLAPTAAGRQWLAAAQAALAQPLNARLPLEETGYFDAANPRAIGLRFTARRGEVVEAVVSTRPATGWALFLELWQLPAQGSPRLLAAADSSLRLRHEVGAETQFLLRLQPELLAGGEYTLRLTTAASLAFPVPAANNPRIISLWGVDRDGGARRHEGIDIAAARRTPLVAGAAGTVVSTRENSLGGKVVFLRPQGRDYQLYYAHLDEQLVREGQQVQAGDVVGLMGNSGNAKTTVPHLHFGIYTSSGAVDPLPFVEQNRAAPARWTGGPLVAGAWLRTTAATNLLAGAGSNESVLLRLPAGTALRWLGGQGSFQRVWVPGQGVEGFVAVNSLRQGGGGTMKLAAGQALLDQPQSSAAAKLRLSGPVVAKVVGSNDGFTLVETEGMWGWVLR